jgi:hypothetical protein
VRIPINPDTAALGGFIIEIDRRMPSSEVKIRPQVVLGPLLPGTTFEQSFVARCANLSEVALMFAREGSAAAQTLLVKVMREDTRWLVRSSFRNGATVAVRDPDPETRIANLARTTREAGFYLTDEQIRYLAATSQEMEHLYFPPLPDSEGKRYVITITTTGGLPDETLSVYASYGDDYADGEGRRDGRRLGRDLVFYYGCSPR